MASLLTQKMLVKDKIKLCLDEIKSRFVCTDVIAPVVFKLCNGNGAYSFSDAFIQFELQKGCSPVAWYNDVLAGLFQELCGQDVMNARQKQALDKLLTFMSESK